MQSVDAHLDRPIQQRALEFRYRFGQAVVFGLPVLGLQFWGNRLGGPESQRWVALFQALLSGWVLYVVATGLVFEGLLHLRRCRVTADLLVGAAALVLYVWSAAALATVPATGALWHHQTQFHLCVGALAVWCGVRWVGLRRSAAPRGVSNLPAR